MQAKDLLAEIRATGMTQAKIAAKTGIPQPTISKIERGEVSDVFSRNYLALQDLYKAVFINKSPRPTPNTKEA